MYISSRMFDSLNLSLIVELYNVFKLLVELLSLKYKINLK